MRFFTIAAALVLAAIRANAGTPAAGDITQIQPTTRGSFPRAPCLTAVSAANGTAVIINDCTFGEQQRGWDVVAGGGASGAGIPGAIKIFNTFCLEVTDGVNASGTKVEINSCVDGDPNQSWQWNADGTVQWAGTDKCLDLTNGDLSNGNQMQISTCVAGDQNQQWTSNPLANPVNEVVLASDTSLCMAADSSDNGAPVFITSCSDTTSRKVWTLPQIGHGNSGRYALAFGPGGTAPIKCLDVTDGQDGQAAPGTKLQLWDCTTDHDISQGFLPTGVIAWQASGFNGLCVDLTDGIKNKGNQLQISNCTADPNQVWNDVSPPQTAI